MPSRSASCEGPADACRESIASDPEASDGLPATGDRPEPRLRRTARTTASANSPNRGFGDRPETRLRRSAGRLVTSTATGETPILGSDLLGRRVRGTISASRNRRLGIRRWIAHVIEADRRHLSATWYPRVGSVVGRSHDPIRIVGSDGRPPSRRRPFEFPAAPIRRPVVIALGSLHTPLRTLVLPTYRRLRLPRPDPSTRRPCVTASRRQVIR